MIRIPDRVPVSAAKRLVPGNIMMADTSPNAPQIQSCASERYREAADENQGEHDGRKDANSIII
jgi:hypothetical protein